MEHWKVCEAPQQDVGREARTSNQPPCPVCGGPLLLMRRFWSCQRCHYRACEDCDSGPTEGY